MKPVDLWNLGALAFAVVLSMVVVWLPAFGARGADAPSSSAAAPSRAPTLVDHSGDRLALGRYVRIASLSTVGDELLLELCEPDRIVAFTAYSARNAAKGYRFAGKPALEGAGDIERLLALRPDLVLVSRIGDARPLARMREAGLSVYDLGEMRGMTTLIANVHEVAALVGHPERGDAFADRLSTRMRQGAAAVPAARRKRGMYLSVYGGRLYGGARGTSYDDVLTAAGLVDAAEAYRDWPEYSAEQVLAIDPDVIVTNEEMKPRICEHAGLERLRACTGSGAFAALDGGLLGDPGPTLLDAADAVRSAVYGAP
jgi:iron complex transport system substrate-binding protein